MEIVGAIRNVRNSKNIPQTKPLTLQIKAEDNSLFESFLPILRKLANLTEVTFTKTGTEGAISFVQASDEFFIPMEGNIDPEAEKARLLKELEYAKGFLISVDKKLSNERFVSSAPENVIDMERKKRADAEAKIKALEQSLLSF